MTHSSPEVKTGIVIVDHGSRRQASNEMLHTAVQQFLQQTEFDIVEPAHMELAQPDIAAAFSKCVERGARRVVVFPYFLSVGRHWSEDIPRLVEAAARPFPDVEWLVTAPFGLHPDMSQIISDRISHCTLAAEGRLSIPEGEAASIDCDACHDSTLCLFRTATTSTPVQ